MKVLGSVNLLKKEIENTYKKKLNEFEKEQTEEWNKEKIGLMEEHGKNLKKIEAELKNEEKKVFKTALSEEKLNAKKEFENKRENLINSVFEKALEGSRDVLLSKEYTESVKEFIKEKENIELAGNYEEYKTDFQGITLDNKLNGLIMKEGNKVFDFTYNTFIDSRRLDLRHKISRLLFE